MMPVVVAKVVVSPVAEPLTLDECRAHLGVVPYEVDSDGVGTHPDDALILAQLGAAREHCEAFTGLSIAQKTYEIALDVFPAIWPAPGWQSVRRRPGLASSEAAIELPHPPLVDLLSVAVGTDSDAELDPDTYTVDDYAVPARLVPASAWPTVVAGVNLIKVRYVAGYGDDSDSQPLPQAVRAALLLLLGHLYRNREDSVDRALVSIPTGVEALLRPLRVRTGIA